MKREIKFRGIGYENDVFYYGDLQQNSIGDTWISELDSGEGNRGFFINVKYDTVGQFTGLKDKNGVDIYEGDIVKAYHSEHETTETRPVTFEYGTFTIGRYWKDGTHDWISMEQYETWELEVIGNIYQNQELLK